MTTLSSSLFHVDADGYLICSVRARIEEVMPLQIFVIPGAIPRPLLSRALSRDCVPLKLAYLLAHTSN
jgi:hypothetical protein